MSFGQYRRLNNHPAGAIIAFVIFKLTSVMVVAVTAKLLDVGFAKLVPLPRPSASLSPGSACGPRDEPAEERERVGVGPHEL